jgi:hypothetical protein
MMGNVVHEPRQCTFRPDKTPPRLPTSVGKLAVSGHSATCVVLAHQRLRREPAELPACRDDHVERGAGIAPNGARFLLVEFDGLL